jgi:hypothetical protein
MHKTSRASKPVAVAPAMVHWEITAVEATAKDLGERAVSPLPLGQSGLSPRQEDTSSHRIRRCCDQSANDNAAERWAPIAGYPGYEVSDHGRARRGARILPLYPDGDGYPHCSLFVGGKWVCPLLHRLVAVAFHGPCPSGMEVDHLDGDKNNASAPNLEYVTHSENMRRAVRLGKWNHARGQRNGMAKLNRAKALRIVALARSGTSQHETAGRLGVSRGTVSNVLRGHLWGHVTGLPRIPRKPRHLPHPTSTEAAR